MKSVQILDCTLRDGGYVNNWEFGEKNIQSIINKLVESKVDIIECGFLSQKNTFHFDSSQFSHPDNLKLYIPEYHGNVKLVAMINYGDYIPEEIPPAKQTSLDGIRLAFHKKDWVEAMEFCQKLKNKGYLVFVQPMVSLSYSDEEFLTLIQKANELSPYAFYLVDTFGSMKKEQLLHLMYLLDYNLDHTICVGFHSHNNLQLSYSHAQALVGHLSPKHLIIDSSVMGMGRGAGNLNTELFASYLNDVFDCQYQIKPILQIMDSVLGGIYQAKYWGYSLPQYLSAQHNCHPNYAVYLDNKNTLTVENMNVIFSRMDPFKKLEYDKKYIDKLYIQYQNERTADSQSIQQLFNQLFGRDILILAPGKSLREESEKIQAEIAQKNPIIISVNFYPEQYDIDYVFISNIRRWEDLKGKHIPNLILTSNLRDQEQASYVVNYMELLNDEDAVRDNAGMLLVALLIKAKARSIGLAGLDGYGHSDEGNFVKSDMEFRKNKLTMNAMNLGMIAMLNQYSQKIPISFVTTPRYVYLDK